jgi:hypothetical protein
MRVNQFNTLFVAAVDEDIDFFNIIFKVFDNANLLMKSRYLDIIIHHKEENVKVS